MRISRVMILPLLFALATGVSSAQDARTKNSDSHLVREVRHELVMLPWYSVFDNIRYSVNGGEVTLSGQVTEPTIKSNAGKAVKDIEGVDRVNNQIEVLPVSPMDDQIRRAEYRAIYAQDRLSRYGVGALQSIHIIVKGGHVTLEGFVDNQGDKDAAGIYAKGVPNVFSVENNLIVGSNNMESSKR